jgi:hypothetical protein
VRIIRNDKKIRSYKDAQGFRKEGKKLQVKDVDAIICHYGWVKPPEYIRSKLQYFHTLWHDEEWMKKNKAELESFDYSGIDSLALFQGMHPSVMQKRIREKNWKFDFDPSQRKFSIISRFLKWVEKKTGVLVGEYKNYKILKYKK